jgi:hypothetical protein
MLGVHTVNPHNPDPGPSLDKAASPMDIGEPIPFLIPPGTDDIAEDSKASGLSGGTDDITEDSKASGLGNEGILSNNDDDDIAGGLARGEETFENASVEGPPRVQLTLRVYLLEEHLSYLEIVINIVYETDGTSNKHLSRDTAGFRLTFQHLDLSSPLEVNEVVPDAKITAIKEGGYCSTAMVAVTDIPPHVTKVIPNRMYMANHRQVFQVKINRSASCRSLYAWNLYQGKASAVYWYHHPRVDRH